jgi:hypothetical protein
VWLRQTGLAAWAWRVWRCLRFAVLGSLVLQDTSLGLPRSLADEMPSQFQTDRQNFTDSIAQRPRLTGRRCRWHCSLKVALWEDGAAAGAGRRIAIGTAALPAALPAAEGQTPQQLRVAALDSKGREVGGASCLSVSRIASGLLSTVGMENLSPIPACPWAHP